MHKKVMSHLKKAMDHITGHDREQDRKNLLRTKHHKKEMGHKGTMKEAAAGRKENKSAKHRMAESKSMKGK